MKYSVHLPVPEHMTERQAKALEGYIRQLARELQAHCALAFENDIPQIYATKINPVGDEEELPLTHGGS